MVPSSLKERSVNQDSSINRRKSQRTLGPCAEMNNNGKMRNPCSGRQTHSVSYLEVLSFRKNKKIGSANICVFGTGGRGCDKLSEHNTENSQSSADNMIHRRHVGEKNQLQDGDVEKHYLKVRMSGLSKGHHQIKESIALQGAKMFRE